MTIVSALEYTVEELQAMTIEQLQEVHTVLASSKQKKASRKADLVAGIITAKEKEAKKTAKDETAVAVENSVKPKKKKKGTTSTKKKAAEKAGKAKKDDNEEIDLTKLSKDELLAYVQELQQKASASSFDDDELFPQEIVGEKSKYVKTAFESIEDIQKALLNSPMRVYCFIDEGYDDLTQFVVLFANAEAVVLMDQNKEKYSTLTLKPRNFANGVIKYKGSYPYSFYIRESIE